MKIGIIAAMQQECEFFRAKLNEVVHHQYLNLKISIGSWEGHDVCLVQSGIGKVNATLASEWMIRGFKPGLIINTGSAGGIKTGTQVGDFVLADAICHHDVDVSPIGFKFGELPGLPVYFPVKQSWLDLLKRTANELHDRHHIGTIATGEAFIYQDEQVALIVNRFNDVLACDMEAAAVAQICFMHKVDCVVIRNLSDIAGQAAQINFNQYISQAGELSTELVLAFIGAVSLD